MLYGSTSTFGNIGQTVIGQALGNTYLRGQNNPVYRKYDSVGNYKEYAMWHSGNDGAGSGLDADLLDGKNSDAFAVKEHHLIADSATTGFNTTLPLSYAPGMHSVTVNNVGYGSMLAGKDSGEYYWQFLMRPRNNNSLQFRTSAVNEWKTVAFTDSNVASATKLETARTIWGQSFDGTGDVKGAFFFNAGDGTLKIYDVISPTTSLGKESVAIQTAFDQQNPETSGYPGAYEGRCLLLLQPRGGRVGIGTLAPAHKLDVNGSTRIAGTLTSQAIQPATTSTSQSTGYDLGSASAWWKNTYTRRIYLADGIYVYYDSTNQCIRTNAPIVSDGFISAGGVSTT